MKKVLLGFASSALLAIGCGGGGGGGGNCTVAGASSGSLKLVANSIVLPSSSDASKAEGFGKDLNGDKTADNKLGGLLSILNGVSSTGSGPQSSVDAAIYDAGTFILLMNAEQATASDCSKISVGFGATAPGNFDVVKNTSGKVTSATPKAAFALSGSTSDLAGPIAASILATNDPVTAEAPFTVNVKLPLITGAPAIELTLTAAHITLNETKIGASLYDSANVPMRQYTGQINGAIKNSDLRSTVLPGVAAALTAILNDASAEATTKTAIKSLLDKGCTGSTTAMANDNKIDTCEVSDGALKSALTPDLDLYSDTSKDAAGNVVGSYGVYDPKPSAATAMENDALSFGVGFNAVGATY